MPETRSGSAGGDFGNWIVDDQDLPAFEYALLAEAGRRRVGGRVLPRDDPRAPWHLIGDSHIKALAHAGGWVELWAVTRGFMRMTAGPAPATTWRVAGPDGELLLDPVDDATAVRATFGTSYVEWRAISGDLSVERRLGLMPGRPGVLEISTSVTGAPEGSILIESWPVSVFPLMVGGLMSRQAPAFRDGPLLSRLIWDGMLSLTSLSRSLTDLGRRGASLFATPEFEVTSDPPACIAHPAREVRQADTPSLFDLSHPILFLAAVDDASGQSELEVVGSNLEIRTNVEGGDQVRALIGFAADAPEIRDLLANREPLPDARDVSGPAEVGLLGLALQTHPEAPSGGADAADELVREATWHSACLRSLLTHDDYFETVYPSQASAYGFIHGLQGAPRDYALSSVPLAFFAPDAARGTLEVMMRMTRSDGAMHYAHAGRGQVISGGIHSYPSDLPIFLLWALTEYVWATGDQTFLDKSLPFYPKGRGDASTVRERVGIAFRQLRDALGTGEHGLLRVGSGDWSDPISAMAPDRSAFHERGESGFNTAFAAYALPRAAELIRRDESDLADEMCDFASTLARAMAEAHNGRWFLRGFDGLGSPIGDNHLFLDGQVWPLIGEIGGESERAALAETIQDLLIDPSRIGATILDRPHWVRMGILPPGWDCNGGVWAALNALLAWGLATVDAARGFECLQRQLLARHAREYPHIWYGVWSGPDAYNSWMGEREGETFVQPATPMAEFPTTNSNAHSGPLLAMLRVLGVETSPDGPIIIARPGCEDLPLEGWALETALGRFSSA